MAESEARNWLLVWMEDLLRRAGSKRFWEEEQDFPETFTSSPSAQIFHQDQ